MAATEKLLHKLWLLIATVSLLWSASACTAVLPEDRADVMYHNYDGGGMEIDGPSVLVRKSVSDNVSISANYYVDSISAASVDVLATASPYREERTEKSVGMDFLHEKTMLSTAYTRSTENDFEAKTASLGVTQDFFGDLTTLSMGFSKGSDTVKNVTDASFSEEVSRRNYRLSISQIVSKNMIASLNWETITDEGFLNNPYRSVRYRDATDVRGYSYEAELYPNTRTSNAGAIRTRYFMPWRAALGAEYREFSDSWDIRANTIELTYSQSWQENWLFDISLRRYKQSQAEFYSDLFSRSEETAFRARDKEMSEFNSEAVGLAVSYAFRPGKTTLIERASVNLQVDYIRFDYDNFRNVLDGNTAGQEALYDFSATVSRLFFSIWY